MIKTTVVLVAALGLAACGGSRYSSSNASGGYNAPSVKFASGPLQKACQASDRKARSRVRCGCIQAVADQSLSGADQRRGAKFFKDPGKLQDVRQSDNASNERFWKVWKAYGQTAAAVCKGS